jgi:hypothetical protein
MATKAMNDEVRPLRKYKTPRYPTISKIGEADLSRVPARWSGVRALASTLGAVAMSLKSLAMDGDAESPKTPPAPTAVVPNAAKPSAEKREAPVTDVCPLPPAALAGDGAGAFGCVAMNPPVMLPEAEALEIIEREFKKRGIDLVDAPEIDGVEAPVSELEERQKNPHLVANIILRQKFGEEEIRKKRKWMLDFGTKDGSMMVEYISGDDERCWIRDPRRDGIYSSASGCSTRGAAELAVKGFSARTEGSPVKIGVFYDPLASAPEDIVEKRIQAAGRELNWRERSEIEDKCGCELAEKKLVAQIEHFFDYMAKCNASDTASH